MAKQANTTPAEEEISAATPAETGNQEKTNVPQTPPAPALAVLMVTAEKLVVGQLMYGKGAKATLPRELAKKIEKDGHGEIIAQEAAQSAADEGKSSVPRYTL